MARLISGRHAGRELALRALFQVDVGGASPEEAFEAVRDPERYAEETSGFARELLSGASAHADHLNSVIERNAKGWSLDRMANVDRNILRLALYELLYRPDTPPSVVVDEAVELAKRYSTAESGRFVNGVLGNVVRNLEQERSEA
ncbi:MAG: transcription antitermination factor NusB [Armatimonadota bacterium]